MNDEHQKCMKTKIWPYYELWIFRYNYLLTEYICNADANTDTDVDTDVDNNNDKLTTEEIKYNISIKRAELKIQKHNKEKHNAILKQLIKLHSMLFFRLETNNAYDMIQLAKSQLAYEIISPDEQVFAK
jgi:hypothetical protein